MDLTQSAIPVYFATMGLEHRALQRRSAELGPSPADYQSDDTRTSLAMGVLSGIVPIVATRALRPFVPGKGRFGRALVATAVGAVAVTTVADRVAGRARKRSTARAARRVARAGGITAVVTGGVAITSAWTALVDTNRLWERRIVRDLGTGPAAIAAAILGWDFIYYWNHRFMHSSRYMWAIHAVHHSSERYNLSTALRQPVADVLGTFVPYGLLAFLGVRPALIFQARGINLLYQYWIHTETVRTIGPLESVLNTASHHRVHHGSNRQYLDRNHGSIFIVWDRLFGTFEPEADPVVYGLTTNIETFNPARVAAHEHLHMLRDVGRATSWHERLSFVLRGPGWAYARHSETAANAITAA